MFRLFILHRHVMQFCGSKKCYNFNVWKRRIFCTNICGKSPYNIGGIVVVRRWTRIKSWFVSFLPSFHHHLSKQFPFPILLPVLFGEVLQRIYVFHVSHKRALRFHSKFGPNFRNTTTLFATLFVSSYSKSNNTYNIPTRKPGRLPFAHLVHFSICAILDNCSVRHFVV